MKTPDEIKKALECCFQNSEQCVDCPYYPTSCDRELVRDAREYIRQLEAERASLLDIIKYESTFLSIIPLPCRCCKNAGDFTKDTCCFCGTKEAYGNFEWCGLQKEE